MRTYAPVSSRFVPALRWRLTGVLVLVLSLMAVAADRRIYLIEYVPSANLILLHFDTDPFRAYRVEYKTSLMATQWTTFASIPAYPFDNHFVLTDYATNSQRFYRLLTLP